MLYATLCIDPSLGRFDRNTLSDQARMELLVGTVLEGDKDNARKPRLHRANGTYRDVCNWQDIMCDADLNVFLINWSGQLWLKGSEDFRFAYLPSRLEVLLLARNMLRGPLELRDLPAGMKKLEVSYNLYSGSVDVAHLPATMEHLNIEKNMLSGSIAVAELPKTMKILSIKGNAIDITGGRSNLDACVFLTD